MSGFTMERFRPALDGRFSEAKREKQPYLEVNSGSLHREVGGYPGPTHRMPVCCGAMRNAMRTGDKIVDEPPKGNGTSLTIRYKLA